MKTDLGALDFVRIYGSATEAVRVLGEWGWEEYDPKNGSRKAHNAEMKRREGILIELYALKTKEEARW